MKELRHIKAVSFDYGGTLDLPGIHWFDFLWDLVSTRLNTLIPASREQLWDAYVYGERKLESEPISADTKLLDNLVYKCRYEIDYLADKLLWGKMVPDNERQDIAFTYASLATDIIINGSYPESREVLAKLSRTYQVNIVSNYYGNLKTILSEAGFMPYITHAIDSTVVGIRKPDPAIWQLVIDASGYKPEEMLIVGDSMKNDILPGQHLGCHTAWLTEQPDPAYKGLVIPHLSTLLQLLD